MPIAVAINALQPNILKSLSILIGIFYYVIAVR